MTDPTPRPVPEPCPNAAAMGAFACANRHQCWEPCGELGHSAPPGSVPPAPGVQVHEAAPTPRWFYDPKEDAFYHPAEQKTMTAEFWATLQPLFTHPAPAPLQVTDEQIIQALQAQGLQTHGCYADKGQFRNRYVDLTIAAFRALLPTAAPAPRLSEEVTIFLRMCATYGPPPVGHENDFKQEATRLLSTTARADASPVPLSPPQRYAWGQSLAKGKELCTRYGHAGDAATLGDIAAYLQEQRP